MLDLRHRGRDRGGPVRVVQVEIENPDRPRAALAERPGGRGRRVQVAVSGHPARAGVVSRRAAQRVGEAHARQRSPRRPDRRAHRLAGGGHEPGANRDVGRQARGRECRQHHRPIAPDPPQRVEVVGIVQRAQDAFHVLVLHAGRRRSHAGVAHQPAAEPLQATIVVQAPPDTLAFADPRGGVIGAATLLDQQQLAHRAPPVSWARAVAVRDAIRRSAIGVPHVRRGIAFAGRCQCERAAHPHTQLRKPARPVESLGRADAGKARARQADLDALDPSVARELEECLHQLVGHRSPPPRRIDPELLDQPIAAGRVQRLQPARSEHPHDPVTGLGHQHGARAADRPTAPVPRCAWRPRPAARRPARPASSRTAAARAGASDGRARRTRLMPPAPALPRPSWGARAPAPRAVPRPRRCR